MLAGPDLDAERVEVALSAGRTRPIATFVFALEFPDNAAVRHAHLSRRTWLWTSSTALAAACARPAPSRLPAGGPEPARTLTRLGAENLRVLAELGATLRWFHPSDQAMATEWEPLLLDGIRGLERAESRAELVEGLRGLFGDVAPTVVIWRAEPDTAVGITPDEPACAPSEPVEPVPASAESGPSEQPAEPAAEENDPVTTPVDRARAPTEKFETRAPADAHPPARTQPGAPSEREREQPAAPVDVAPETPAPAPVDVAPETPAPAPAPAPASASAPAPVVVTGDELEPRPPLHEALFAEGDALEICQWHRQGFCEGLEGQVGCAQRIHRRPDAPTHDAVHQRGQDRQGCQHCDADAPLLTPAAPTMLALPRGLASLVPIALWARDGRTLPESSTLAPAPVFDESRAWDYELGDRGTRLLAVLRCYSLLRCFYAQRERVAAVDELLRSSLCAAAEAEDPAALQVAIEQLLAGFADGNAELRVEFGKPARRFVPALSLAWVDERVVVRASSLAEAHAGDVVTMIDGVAIDELLAQELPRTGASTPSAAIARTVERLLARRERGAELELELLRSDAGEQRERVVVRASEGLDAPALDPRPQRPVTELREHVWYVDPTRARLHVGAGLRRARVVIVDLRGSLAEDQLGQCLGHWLSEPLELARGRNLSGPDHSGELTLIDAAPIIVTPRRSRLHARVLVLADHRTRGAAELELLGFEALGATIIGSNSAGALGVVSHAWLPGGWQLRFTSATLLTPDGRSPWARGVAPSIHVEPTRAGLRAGLDELLQAALDSEPAL